MKLLRRLLALVALATATVFAQPAEKSAAPVRALTKFNLDFPGGTPGELAAAIQKATGRPFNVVIPTEHASKPLPPLKMNGVDVAQLFAALELLGPKTEVIPSGNGNYSTYQSTFGFKSRDLANLTDDSIWTFYVVGNPRNNKVSRFYLLSPYLEAGLSVDDITTAIQTGWKMRGEAEVPQLSFHNETKLLIAVGDYGGLDVIESVLKALDGSRKAKPADATPADAKKTKP